MALNVTKEEALYRLKSLPLWLEGLELNDPKMVTGIQEFLRTHEEEIQYKRRTFSDGYTPFVYQLSETPPAYCIHPYFEGIRQIVQELKMPTDLDRLFFLRYFHGGDFRKYKRHSFKKFKRYTVEALGIRIRVPNVNPCKLEMYPLPDPAQYNHPPIYWFEEHWCPIQVWRIRVFACPLETIRVPLSNPLNPNVLSVSQFEWRWHPENDPKWNVNERPHKRTSRNTEFLSYLKYFRRITGAKNKRGRPEEFTDQNFFFQTLADAYLKQQSRNRKPPSQSLIAEVELGIDRKTLRKYLKLFKIHWPPY